MGQHRQRRHATQEVNEEGITSSRPSGLDGPSLSFVIVLSVLLSLSGWPAEAAEKPPGRLFAQVAEVYLSKKTNSVNLYDLVQTRGIFVPDVAALEIHPRAGTDRVYFHACLALPGHTNADNSIDSITYIHSTRQSNLYWIRHYSAEYPISRLLFLVSQQIEIVGRRDSASCVQR